MRDNRGVNRIAAVLSSRTESGDSADLLRKSSATDPSAVLKEHNDNESADIVNSCSTTADAENSKEIIQNVIEANSESASDIETSAKPLVDIDAKRNDVMSVDDDDDEEPKMSVDVDDTRAKSPSSSDRCGAGTEQEADNETQLKLNGSSSCDGEESKNVEPCESNQAASDEKSEDEASKNDSSAVVVNGLDKNVALSPKGENTESSNTNELPKDAAANEEESLDTDAEKSSAPSKKRKLSMSSEEDQAPPAKSLRTELEANFAAYDRILHGMLESATSSPTDDPDNIQRDIDQLSKEIDTLADAARTKEIEWNNILYLKKMKEDMLLRLNRKKTVMEIVQSKIGDETNSILHGIGNYSNSDSNDVTAASNNDDRNNSAGMQKQLANAIKPNTAFILSRCNMNSSDLAKERSSMNSADLAKEKSTINRLHKNNRPKSTQSVRVEPTNLTNFVTSIPKSSPAIQYEFLQQRLRDDFQSSSGTSLDNLNSKMQVGRQGPIKDVKSLIDDFRQQHPEEVPRRGRRVKNTGMGQAGFLGESSASLGRDNDISSPPSSNDSTYGNQQLLVSTAAKVGVSSPYNLISTSNFKQSFNEHNMNPINSSTPLFKGHQQTGVGYPEVTLHPIQSPSGHSSHLQNQKHSQNLSDNHSESLLHNILTKSSRQKGSSTVTSSMMTQSALASLLTAPERNFTLNSSITANNGTNGNAFFSSQSPGVNLSKSNKSRTQQQQSQPEISCLPISQITALQQQLAQQHHNQNSSLLRQQLQRNQRDIHKYLPKNNIFINMDDEADDSDRLVIDEGDQYSNSDQPSVSGMGRNDDIHENELPECQGCKKREAQFVCADCQRQWYCSRECQVMAWDEHSEVCAR